MDVFTLRDSLVSDYRRSAETFLAIRDERIRDHVARQLPAGVPWLDPPLQLGPSYDAARAIAALVAEGSLHEACEGTLHSGKGRRPGTEPVAELASFDES